MRFVTSGVCLKSPQDTSKRAIGFVLYILSRYLGADRPWLETYTCEGGTGVKKEDEIVALQALFKHLGLNSELGSNMIVYANYKGGNAPDVAYLKRQRALSPGQKRKVRGFLCVLKPGLL